MLRNLLPWLACLGAITLAPAGPQSALPASRWVPEMERVRELHWPRANDRDYAEERRQMLAAWQEISAGVRRKLTAAEVVQLSKWAKPQMQNYAAAPVIGQPDFQLQTASAGEKELVFEATLQVLPSHSPLVTRWLKLFVLYDRSRRAIPLVVVTIRGEAQEEPGASSVVK